MITLKQTDTGGMDFVDARTGNIAGHLSSTSLMPSMKIGSLTRTDTLAKTLFTLPKGAVPIKIEVYVATASDATSTAVISVGKSGTNTYFANTVDVKSAAGQVAVTSKAGNMMAALTVDTPVLGIYAETGTASTVGTFYVVIYFHK